MIYVKGKESLEEEKDRKADGYGREKHKRRLQCSQG